MAHGKLSCGHVATPQPAGSGGTGYARLPSGKRICYDCADKRQQEEMRTKNDFMAYVSGDGKHITSWSGGTLGTVTSMKSRSNIFMRGDKLYSIRVRDIHGQEWYGTTLGPHMYARLHKSKKSRGDVGVLAAEVKKLLK